MPVPTRRHLAALLLSAALALTSCSEGDILVDVDLQSFVTESGTLPDPAADYAVLTLPVAVTITGLEVLAPQSVELVGVLDDVAAIRSVLFTYAVQAAHREGEARAVLRMRLAATRAGLAAPGAVLDTLVLDLGPATSETVTRSVNLRDELVDLFRGSQLWLSAEGDVHVEAATAPGDSVAGRLWLRDTRATITADSDFF